MKRNQKNQITKDNNNSEDEEEEVGQMKLASASVLSTRVIKPLRKKTSFNTTNPFASLSTPIQPVTAPTPVKSTNDMYSNYASLNICLSNEIKYRLEKNPTTDLSHLLAEYYDKRAAIESKSSQEQTKPVVNSTQNTSTSNDQSAKNIDSISKTSSNSGFSFVAPNKPIIEQKSDSESKPQASFSFASANSNVVESKQAAQPVFSFVAPKPDSANSNTESKLAAQPVFSFVSPKSDSTNSNTESKQAAQPCFSFVAPKSDSTTSAAPSFGFNATRNADSQEKILSPPPSFSFSTTKPADNQEKGTSATPSFSFGASKPADNQDKAKPDTEKTNLPVFSFVAPSKDAKPAALAFSFAAPKTDDQKANPAPMFNFASAPAAPQSNNSQFSFGSQSSDKPSAPAFSFSAPTTNAVQNPQFSFTTPFINNAAATPFKFNAPTQNTEPETNENDDEEDGVKEDQIDSKAFMTGAGEEDETTQFETRCKLFKMENDKWELIGLGDLKIKLNKNGKRRFLLRADMSGRVLLNCGLFKGMPVKRLNPKQVFVKCAVEGNTLQDFLFQVKDKGVGDLFEQAIANAST